MGSYVFFSEKWKVKSEEWRVKNRADAVLKLRMKNEEWRMGSYVFFSEKWRVKSEEWKIALTQFLNEEWRMKNEEYELILFAWDYSIARNYEWRV